MKELTFVTPLDWASLILFIVLGSWKLVELINKAVKWADEKLK